MGLPIELWAEKFIEKSGNELGKTLKVYLAFKPSAR